MRLIRTARIKGGEMLDDANVLKQHDAKGALDVAAALFEQTKFDVQLRDADHDNRKINQIVIAGMGGSALAADLAKSLLAEVIDVPLEVIKGYELPLYVGKHTLVITSSHSGNTEETVACLEQAIAQKAQVAATATGGQLDEISEANSIMFAHMPHDTQPRMAVIYNLRSIIRILVEFGMVKQSFYDEITSTAEWLGEESARWCKDVPTKLNYAKQLALLAVGKTPIFYSGSLMAPVAYKWKISWNENAKNVAFWNYLPEFNHNEFLGWTSHPIEKPFVIFDLVSEFEHPRVLKRFSLTDKLLSGKRPKANIIPLAGESVMEQTLWACILADFVSIYVAILNGVDPTQVDLIEKFKKELVS